MRYLPLAAILAFIAIAFGWRAWLQSRRYGTSGILLFRSTRRGQIVRDSLTLVWFAVLIGQAAAAALWPEWLARRALLASPAGPAADILGPIGAVLLVAGLVLMVTAQLELGASWRIGIDPAARPGLVTSGLYRYSRNPIFLAFLVILVGYALLIPTALSLALLIGTYVGVRGQIAAEEAYLEHAYGEAYRDYAGRVGRFVPGIGRRR
jgi:protein-S-isoprenylcysteine O-methyltransferase Ste14